MAFGHIATRLTAAKEEGAFVTTPDGQKVALGIPMAQKGVKDQGGAFKDIPLGRPGTATEAASAVLAVVSPLFSYVSVVGLSVAVDVLADNFVGQWTDAERYGGEKHVSVGSAMESSLPSYAMSPSRRPLGVL